MQNIPIGYPKQQQSSALTAAFITHLHYHTSSSDLVRFKNSFFVHYFNIHPEGKLLWRGSRLWNELWLLLSITKQQRPPPPSSDPALAPSCPWLLSELTLLQFSKLWTHLSGQCQTGRPENSAVIRNWVKLLSAPEGWILHGAPWVRPWCRDEEGERSMSVLPKTSGQLGLMAEFWWCLQLPCLPHITWLWPLVQKLKC